MLLAHTLHLKAKVLKMPLVLSVLPLQLPCVQKFF